MDFSDVAIDVADQVMATIDSILLLDISPADKRTRIAKVLNTVGSDYFEQMYGATSQVVGSTIKSTGLYFDITQADRLAVVVLRNHALMREIAPLIREYYDSVLAQAQAEAFNNGKSMQKHPTLIRRLVGETCSWCRDLVGEHTNPQPIYFARHDNCDCLIKVSGYNTRNGLLKNYKKKKGEK